MSEQQKSKSETEQAWEAAPDLVAAQTQELARRFYKKGELGRAEEVLGKLIKMRPAMSWAHALLGVVYRRQGRLLKALESLQRAAEIDNTDRNTLVNLGECLVLAGKVPEGVDVLRAVFEMGYDPEKAPEEHDMLTRRAGAQLEVIQRAARKVEADLRAKLEG
ncbi:tetratricopeptide repeat protein [Lujinxingia vulgaris]|uniref:Tetratricopeptide repeat protein n=1 Tax=Lujinxingia vulgaris TaxID=2600176 RepID=A0A5C6XGZ9_9DELT|nr:tetratricopeptide repeat protein [Lujinxingia vulgaris]TXD36478.1 tetratricopeptide repeat protein [Lujinxingia vulgaris]